MITDLIVGIVILLLVIRGFIRGLIKEVVFFIAGIIGLLIADMFWKVLDSQIKTFFPSSVTSHFASYIIIFIAAFIGILILCHFIRKIVNVTLLMWLDKIGGGVVGFLKGVVICGLLLMVISSFWPEVEKGTRVSLYVKGVTQRLLFLVPENLRKEFDKEREHITEYFSEDFWYKLFNIKKGKRKL